MVNKCCLLAELPTQTDPKRPNSCPLINASNEHKRPNDLRVFTIPPLAVCFSHTLVLDIFLSFLSLSVPSCLRLPPTHFLHGSVIPPLPPLDGISAAVTSVEAAPPWFLPSLRTSLPLSLFITNPPSLASSSSSSSLVLASISYRASVVSVCNPDYLQPNWTVADFKRHGNNFCRDRASLFPPCSCLSISRLPFPLTSFFFFPSLPWSLTYFLFRTEKTHRTLSRTGTAIEER